MLLLVWSRKRDLKPSCQRLLVLARELHLGFGLLHGSGAPAWSVRTVAGARDSQVLKRSRMNTPPKGSPGEQHLAGIPLYPGTSSGVGSLGQDNHPMGKDGPGCSGACVARRYREECHQILGWNIV